MKISIRRNVFETNSSSTHSLTMCSKDDYKKWENGELLFNEWRKRFVEATEENKANGDNKTYQEWYDYCDLETFYDSYTTKTGEEIVAFGCYGYDG